MQLSPKGIIHQAAYQPEILSTWKHGSSWSLRPVSKYLNLTEILFLQVGHQKALESASPGYQDILHNNPSHWIAYLRKTGHLIFDAQDHTGFIKRKSNIDAPTYTARQLQEALAQSAEVRAHNPYDASTFTERIFHNKEQFRKIYGQARKEYKIYVPGPEATIARPTHSTAKKHPKKMKLRQAYWYAYRIQEQLQDHPQADRKLLESVTQHDREVEAAMRSLNSKSPQGRQTSLGLRTQQKNPTFYERPLTYRSNIPRGANIEQKDLFEDT